MRALQRLGYVFKKNEPGPRNSIVRVSKDERAAFHTWAATIDPRRFVFLDESGANLAMGRSHAWVPRGAECIELRPINWGDNLTMVGAMRLDGWLTLATGWSAMTAPRFLAWVQRRLVPRLRLDHIVVLDNLAAHQTVAVREAIERTGARCASCRPTRTTSIRSKRAGP